MYFKLRKEAKAWFKGVASYYKVDFELYYLCLIAGLSKGQIDLESQYEANDLVDYFPGPFRSRGRILIGLLIREELERLAISLSDQVAVRKKIKEIVSSDSPSGLSDEGVKLMNSYASGGYRVLLETFEDRPRTIETFLRTYYAQINSIIQKRSQQEICSP